MRKGLHYHVRKAKSLGEIVSLLNSPLPKAQLSHWKEAVGDLRRDLQGSCVAEGRQPWQDC